MLLSSSADRGTHFAQSDDLAQLLSRLDPLLVAACVVSEAHVQAPTRQAAQSAFACSVCGVFDWACLRRSQALRCPRATTTRRVRLSGPRGLFLGPVHCAAHARGEHAPDLRLSPDAVIRSRSTCSEHA